MEDAALQPLNVDVGMCTLISDSVRVISSLHACIYNGAFCIYCIYRMRILLMGLSSRAFRIALKCRLIVTGAALLTSMWSRRAAR